MIPLFRAVFWALLLLVWVLSLMPVDRLPQVAFDVWDKAQHALAFAALGLAGWLAYGQHKWRVSLGLLVCGALIEWAQSASGMRFGDPLDWLADAAGLLLAGAVWWGLRRWRLVH